MKIAIPTANGALCSHFGHCAEFTIVEVNAESKQILSTQTIPAPEHEPGLLPRWLRELGADVVIAGGMGGRAQGLFAESGIKVCVGAQAAPTADLVADYLAGTLKTGVNLCDH